MPFIGYEDTLPAFRAWFSGVFEFEGISGVFVAGYLCLMAKRWVGGLVPFCIDQVAELACRKWRDAGGGSIFYHIPFRNCS
jgi:hypothetical protein